MNVITKYKAFDGQEFLTKEECINYENTIVDKNGNKIKFGDWVKESWYFHGFSGDSLLSLREHVGENRNFRFVKYDYTQRFGIDRVSRQGWPTSGYEIEIISEEDMDNLKNDKKYICTSEIKYSSEPYHYRIREKWD